MNTFSIFSTPVASKRDLRSKYPTRSPPESTPLRRGQYKLTALDFGLSLDPNPSAIKNKVFRNTFQHRLIRNDGTEQSLLWLLEARNIFNTELKNMPEQYITRLVFDHFHYTVLLFKNGNVCGAISFRPFFDRNFAEIAFCAVSSSLQISGFGSYLMSLTKMYAQTMKIGHLLTYGDNSAIGYFKRQGFSTRIKLEREKWVHYIKDYQGATLIHCKIDPDVNYLLIDEILDQQKLFVSQLLPSVKLSTIRKFPIRRFQGMEITKKPVYELQRLLMVVLEKLRAHSSAWPFQKPVSKEEAPNYDTWVKQPMDLSTIQAHLDEHKYTSLQQFEADVRLTVSNCMDYNPPGSTYTKTAIAFERFINEIFSQVRNYPYEEPT
jgi:histone acetyltransferase